MADVDKTEAIGAALDMLAEEIGVEVSESRKAALTSYLDRNLVPEGVARPRRQKVPKETVQAIRKEYAEAVERGEGSLSTLANKYGVHVSTVQRYVKGTIRA